MSYIETLSEVKKWDPLFAQHSSIHEAGRFLPVGERVLPPSSGLYKPHNYVIYIYIYLFRFFFCPSLSLSLSLSRPESAAAHSRAPTVSDDLSPSLSSGVSIESLRPID
ncbi:hypothetical protein BHE74_00056487 [Ensete ventricosum]|nr:hypothetical protein BHE74_00056487 [Ensete ventricosum]